MPARKISFWRGFSGAGGRPLSNYLIITLSHYHIITLTMNSILNWISANEQMLYIVILMMFAGIEVIGKVPSVLHTPLMSGANAIHGVVIIGAIIVMGKAASDNYLALGLGFLAVVLGTLNVVGGFVVTDRMLEMFTKKKKKA
jgi:NAD(P) transhydrogenase subunit alpha